MRLTYVWLICLFILIPSSSLASYISTLKSSDLYDYCKSVKKVENKENLTPSEHFDSGICLGFINGLVDMQFSSTVVIAYQQGIKEYEKAEKVMDKNSFFCIPDEVTRFELIRVYMKFIDENPTYLHNAAIWGVINAFNKSYPCEKF